MTVHYIVLGCGHEAKIVIRTRNSVLNYYRSKNSLCTKCYEESREELDLINTTYNNFCLNECTIENTTKIIKTICTTSKFSANRKHGQLLLKRIGE